MNDPILCTGNELRYVLESLEKRGMFPWSLDTGVGGNAGYSVSYFNAVPNRQNDGSVQPSHKREPVSATQADGRNAAAGGGTRAEKPAIVPDEPASISIEDLLANLKKHLSESGRLIRSRPQTKPEDARKPYAD